MEDKRFGTVASAAEVASSNGQEASVREKSPHEIGEDVATLERRVDVAAGALGGRWNLRENILEPFADTLAGHARANGIPMLSVRWIIVLAALYYPLILGLGYLYGVMISELQAWENTLMWLGRVTLMLAFVGVAQLVSILCYYAALSKYREDPQGYRFRKGLALGAALVVLTVDYAASYTWLNAAAATVALGGKSQTPPIAVLLTAGLTTLSLMLGIALGYSSGLHDEVKASWWNKVVDESAGQLRELRDTGAELKQCHNRTTYPGGHIKNSRPRVTSTA